MFDDAREAGRVVGVVPLVRREDQLGQSVRNARAEQQRLVRVVQGQQGHRLNDEAQELRVQRVVQRFHHHPQLGFFHQLLPADGRLGQVQKQPGAEDLQAVVAALPDPQTGRAPETGPDDATVQSDGVQHQAEHRPGVHLLRQQMDDGSVQFSGRPGISSYFGGRRRLLLFRLLLLLLDDVPPRARRFATGERQRR